MADVMLADTIATSDGVIVHKDENGAPKAHEGFGGYRFHMLDAMILALGIGYKWEIRSYSPPRSLKLEELMDWFRDVIGETRFIGRTLGWVNKGISVIVLSDHRECCNAKNPLCDKGKTLPWGDIPLFTITMTGKIMKRLAAFAWRSYLNATFTKVVFTVPGEYVAPKKRQLSICVVPKSDLRDGVAQVRPHLMKSMRNKLTADYVGDAEKARALRKRLRDVVRGHFRVFTQIGLLKFDGIIAKSDAALWADIQVSPDNIKGEIKCPEDMAFLEAFAQEQYSEIRTNTQTLANFFTWLLDGLIQPALENFVAQIKDYIITGALPPFLDPIGRTIGHNGVENGDDTDNLGVWMERYMELPKRGVPLTRSLQLTAALFALCRDYLHPKKLEFWECRFPIPFAMSASLTSQTVAFESGYDEIPELNRGEVFLHRIGAVFSDAWYIWVAWVLGGGDQDDHLDVHLRRNKFKCMIPCGADGEMMEILKDEVVLVVTRNPVGNRTNGESIGSEFIVAKLVNWETMWTGSADQIPYVDLRKGKGRPLFLTEVNTDGIDPLYKAPKVMLPKNMKEYENFFDTQLAVSGRAGMAYGTHARQMMAAAWHRMTTSFLEEEGTIVDDMQQERSVEKCNVLDACNATVAKEQRTNMLYGGVALDAAVAEYILPITSALTGDFKLKEKVQLDYNGPMIKLAQFHAKVRNQFAADAKAWMRDELKDKNVNWILAKDLGKTMTAPGSGDTSFPYLLRKCRDMEERYINAQRAAGHTEFAKRDITMKGWTLIGDKVVDEAMAYLTGERGLDEDAAHQRLVKAAAQAYRHAIVNSRVGTVGTLAAFWAHSDRPLINGKLLPLMAEALAGLSIND